MIFYFTGTGNSLYVAKQLDRERISIPQVIHNTELVFEADSIGVVCPIYGHEMPDMVKRFLQKAVFHTNYFYVVLTYGNIHGGAAELTDQMLVSCGKAADYINTIKMVDNFLPGFDMNEQIATVSEKRIDEHLSVIQADIEERKCWKQPATQEDREWHRKYLERQASLPLNSEVPFYRVTEDCIGCGICSKVCPAGCIRLEKQQAIFSANNCQMCMACIHHCPQNAIQLNAPEKNPNARYHNGNIRLTEIVAANNQQKEW